MRTTKKMLLARLFEAKKDFEKVSHSIACPADDPESYAPCSCQAKGKREMATLLDETINFLLDG